MERLFLILILLPIGNCTMAQRVTNIDRLSQTQRDSVLFSITKQGIQEFGPVFLDKIGADFKVILQSDSTNRPVYLIQCLYKEDKLPEFRYAPAVVALIFPDTGILESIMFGGLGIGDLEAKTLADDDGIRVVPKRTGPTRTVFVGRGQTEEIPND